MGIFSKREAIGFTERDTDAERREKAAEWQRRVDAAAKALEPEALEKAPALLAELVADHARDVAGYSFSCKRWGDYLALFIARECWRYEWIGRAGESRNWAEPQKYSNAINIRDTREIVLLAGHGADSAGTLEYWAQSSEEVHARYPYAKTTRGLFSLDPPKDPWEQGPIYMGRQAQPEVRVPNYPRAAEDDRVRFNGIGATIFAPAGCGQAVLDAVLQEIGAHGGKA